MIAALHRQVSRKEWTDEFAPFLTKCKEVITVGHSLGGMMAELFAGCANMGTKDCYEQLNPHWNEDRFQVSKVYTIGAGGFTKQVRTLKRKSYLEHNAIQ